MFPTEAHMPEGLRIIERDEDPYAWTLAQAALLRRVFLRNRSGCAEVAPRRPSTSA